MSVAWPGMGPQRRAPLVQVGADVDLQVDLPPRACRGVAVVHGCIGSQLTSAMPAAFAASNMRRTRSRFIVDSSTRGPAGRELGAAVHQVVDLDVVGVAVAAVPVVAHHDVGASSSRIWASRPRPPRGPRGGRSPGGGSAPTRSCRSRRSRARPPGESPRRRGRLGLARRRSTTPSPSARSSGALPVVAVRREHHHHAVPPPRRHAPWIRRSGTPRHRDGHGRRRWCHGPIMQPAPAAPHAAYLKGRPVKVTK